MQQICLNGNFNIYIYISLRGKKALEGRNDRSDQLVVTLGIPEFPVV